MTQQNLKNHFRGCPILNPDELLPPDITSAPPGSVPPPGEDYYTLANGCPIRNPNASQRIGRQLRGTLLLQDLNLIDIISHITHERIPERLVHAKGAGAYGEFEVTHDITEFTSAAFLNHVGKKTPLFVRFSTVAGEKGSADSVRDARGFAFKMYTEEGNLDWVFFSTPVFQIRDPAKFPSLVHAQKREPSSNLKDPTMFWDYFNRNAEGYNFLMYLFSDMGTPVSYRYADIYSINTYEFTKPDGSFKYVRLTLKTDQGVKDLTQDESVTITGKDPDYFTRDLYDAIAKGNYPSWTVYAQIIDPREAETYHTNIFDATRTISEDDYPLIPFGKITLNRNPVNYFAEVEQAAFAPANIVPGWDITPDPLLHIRLFAYGDTQRYRLGVNFPQLPTNRSFYSYNPTKRDGAATITNYGDLPNYIPSVNGPTIIQAAQYKDRAAHEEWLGSAVNFESVVTDADFVQPREFWTRLTEEQQQHFVYNVAVDLYGAITSVRHAAHAIFSKIDAKLGERIQTETEAMVQANAGMEEIPGVVVGGKDLNATPPTVPAPLTRVESTIFEKIARKVELELEGKMDG
ncbi:hypothetical protein VTN96DRAFT_5399 [Rasamsonia emersonii]|uniref:Catalase n=1 Tax=Rasamsonia emersonii (strain ATCC 16479 / CBS 393.64 / IMI 116815) TaxID=1408163 RepID=A0A0F4Z4Q4_RASE3|nr:CatA, catalase [Rasamsonia emersonii CBS 393.64]KKA25497.1 CatA, catalase [Rasamsonia emersonii CBS 393.64]